MIGLILTHGQSLITMGAIANRSGNGDPNLAELAYRKMTEIGLTSFLSAEAPIQEDRSIYSHMQLIVDQREINAAGPLLGLLSAHRKFPLDDIFVLACNMPFMKSSCLYYLFDLWLERISEIYVYQKGGRATPYCGIYSYNALRQIDRLVTASNKRENSLQYYVQHLNTCYMHIPKEEELAFQTITSQSQLRILYETGLSAANKLAWSKQSSIFLNN